MSPDPSAETFDLAIKVTVDPFKWNASIVGNDSGFPTAKYSYAVYPPELSVEIHEGPYDESTSPLTSDRVDDLHEFLANSFAETSLYISKHRMPCSFLFSFKDHRCFLFIENGVWEWAGEVRNYEVVQPMPAYKRMELSPYYIDGIDFVSLRRIFDALYHGGLMHPDSFSGDELGRF